MSAASSTITADSRADPFDRNAPEPPRRDRPEMLRLGALVFMHVGCMFVYSVGWSWPAVSVAGLLYVLRAFGLTAFYHRYFSHRAFKTSRWFQLVGAVLGILALQKGPLWWAAHHREHHRKSDRAGDVHSPHLQGFVWSHMGWFLTPRNRELRVNLIRDWMKFPELLWLDRCSRLAGVILASGLYGIGEWLRARTPDLHTDGPMLLVWGFFVSTVALYHATYSVNSMAHLFGTRRFATADGSRNNVLVAVLTLGEGWHNNHHHYPASARQGFFWWEIDPTYYVLVALSRLGLVWDLRPVPAHVMRPGQEAGI